MVTLQDFQDLLKSNRSKDFSTFMEITGSVKTESVASGWLAFFLNKNALHHFGDILLKALFETALNKDKINTDTLTVSREESTTETDLKRKKIDLVVRTTSHVIGIENKIRADVNNPLEVYSEHLDKEANKDNLTPTKIILSVIRINDEKIKKNGFVNILYKDFFANLIGKLTEKEVPANPKTIKAAHNWYLYDFIASILNLTQKIEHDWKELEDMKKDMAKIISRGGKIYKGDELTWKGNTLVYEFLIPKHTIKVELYYYPADARWYIYLCNYSDEGYLKNTLFKDDKMKEYKHKFMGSNENQKERYLLFKVDGYETIREAEDDLITILNDMIAYCVKNKTILEKIKGDVEHLKLKHCKTSGVWPDNSTYGLTCSFERGIGIWVDLYANPDENQWQLSIFASHGNIFLEKTRELELFKDEKQAETGPNLNNRIGYYVLYDNDKIIEKRLIEVITKLNDYCEKVKEQSTN